MGQNTNSRLTLAAFLEVLAPTERVFVIHHMGADIFEAVAGGTAEELRSTRCAEVCGDNIVERAVVEQDGYPWDAEPCIVVTVGEKELNK